MAQRADVPAFAYNSVLVGFSRIYSDLVWFWAAFCSSCASGESGRLQCWLNFSAAGGEHGDGDPFGAAACRLWLGVSCFWTIRRLNIFFMCYLVLLSAIWRQAKRHKYLRIRRARSARPTCFCGRGVVREAGAWKPRLTAARVATAGCWQNSRPGPNRIGPERVAANIPPPFPVADSRSAPPRGLQLFNEQGPASHRNQNITRFSVYASLVVLSLILVFLRGQFVFGRDSAGLRCYLPESFVFERTFYHGFHGFHGWEPRPFLSVPSVKSVVQFLWLRPAALRLCVKCLPPAIPCHSGLTQRRNGPKAQRGKPQPTH